MKPTKNGNASDAKYLSLAFLKPRINGDSLKVYFKPFLLYYDNSVIVGFKVLSCHKTIKKMKQAIAKAKIAIDKKAPNNVFLFSSLPYF